MIVAIDFDGTITETHEYPNIGKFNSKAVQVIKKLQKEHVLCLWTCREGEPLKQAVEALEKEGIKFNYINDSPYSMGRKIVANIYIDDRNFGGIDWDEIERGLCHE